MGIIVLTIVWIQDIKMPKVEKVFRPQISSQELPVFIARIAAGFPSPTADYEEGKLDLNKHLIKNSAATFFVRVR